MYMQINMHRIQERGIWKKKDRALGVCDYRGLVFIRRVRYKSLG